MPKAIWTVIAGLKLMANHFASLIIRVVILRSFMCTVGAQRSTSMSDGNSEKREPQAGDGSSQKKPFIEPEIKEFDDLEKQIKSPLIGTFTP